MKKISSLLVCSVMVFSFIMPVGINVASAKVAAPVQVPMVTKLTLADFGKTVAVKLGSEFTFEMKNPPDGMYRWHDAVISPRLFTNESIAERHTLADPNDPTDNGPRIWTFKARKKGTANMTISANRIAQKNKLQTIFKVRVIVK